MRVPLLAALVLLPQSPPAQDRTSARPLDAAVVESVREMTGHHPFDLLAAWAREDSLAGMERFFDDEHRPARLLGAYHASLASGLWAEDEDVAFAAACHVTAGMLDVRDIDRYLDLTVPHLFDTDLRFDFDVFKAVIDGERLDAVLRMRPDPQDEMRFGYVGGLHRSLRPRHVPALCRHVLGPDPLVRRAAFGALANQLLYHGRHREIVARTLLAWPGPGALVLGENPDAPAPIRKRAFVLGPERPGYPPLLRALLQRWFLGLPAHEDGTGFDVWLARWAVDVEPGPKDRDLLLDLLSSPRRHARWVALRGLRAFAADPEVIAALRRTRRRNGADDLEVAAAIAAAGDVGELRRRATTGSPALLAALALGDDAAWQTFTDRAFGADAASGLEALRLLVGAWDSGRSGPLLFPERPYSRLRTVAATHAQDLDFDRLHLLAEAFPSCRTHALADQYLRKLRAEDLTRCLGGMLEVHDETAFRGRLLVALGSDDAGARDTALGWLARLGAPEIGDELVAWVEAAPDGRGFAGRLRWLGRSGTSDVVRTFLRGQLDAPAHDGGAVFRSAWSALATAHGLPEATARSWARAVAELPEARHELRAAWQETLAGGDAVGSLLAFLQATRATGPRPFVRDLGRVDDDRVRRHLNELRARSGPHIRDTILELAIAGDPHALAEIAEVRERHLYGWMDDATDTGRTLAGRLELAPYWIGELGTVCCRRNVALGALEHLMPVDAGVAPEHGLLTQREHARAWWRRNGEHLRWSRIAGRYVVAPR